jgi:hypothetical protein
MMRAQIFTVARDALRRWRFQSKPRDGDMVAFAVVMSRKEAEAYKSQIEASIWDMNVLAKVVNGAADETVVTRHGDEVRTLAGALSQLDRREI